MISIIWQTSSIINKLLLFAKKVKLSKMPKSIEGVAMGWRWKDENKVFEIGKNFVIAPPWLETKKKKITFVEGESFGTGVHETTVSCIEIMENLPIKDKTILDIGSGSGILSIAALKLGAKKAVGFDIEKRLLCFVFRYSMGKIIHSKIGIRQYGF